MAHYNPSAVPSTFPGLRGWIGTQLELLAQVIRVPEVRSVQLEPQAAEPAKYQEGLIVYADGSNWDPGSGAGVYVRGSSSWSKL